MSLDDHWLYEQRSVSGVLSRFAFLMYTYPELTMRLAELCC